jgi:hypothetical protein
LAGILLPMLSRAQDRATSVRIESDFHTISVALTAYRQDFGDYPRLGASDKAPGTDPIYNDLGNPAYLYGAELLCWTLTGPYAEAAAGPWNPADGADGPGFRAMGVRGPVYAYLPTEAFKPTRSVQFSRYFALVDALGNQILYSASRPSGADTAAPGGYCDRAGSALWDFRDNEPAFSVGDDAPSRLARFRKAIGDTNANGSIEAGETRLSGAFFLWSAGVDGMYATDDDVRVTQ